MFGTMLEIAEDACGRAFDAFTGPSSHLSDTRVLDTLDNIDENLRQANNSLSQIAARGMSSWNTPKGPSMAERAQAKWREHAQQGRR